MAFFEINLIKDEVAQPAYRRLSRGVFLLYLACCGVALVIVSYRAAQTSADLFERHRETVAVEKMLAADHIKASEISQRVTTLCADLQQAAEKLECIEKLLNQRVVLAPILLGLVLPLPPEIHIANFEVDPKNNSLRFDLVVPIGPTNHVVHSHALMAAWNDDHNLMKQVRDIRLINTQKKNLGERTVFISHFEGVLRQKG